jgi:hypothetical protein
MVEVGRRAVLRTGTILTCVDVSCPCGYQHKRSTTLPGAKEGGTWRTHAPKILLWRALATVYGVLTLSAAGEWCAASNLTSERYEDGPVSQLPSKPLTRERGT